MWKLLSGGRKVGSTDLWGRPIPCGPHSGFAFSTWLSCGPLHQCSMSTRVGGGLPACGSFNPCDVHASPFDSPGLLPLNQ
jgi:hypothetical protein